MRLKYPFKTHVSTSISSTYLTLSIRQASGIYTKKTHKRTLEIWFAVSCEEIKLLYPVYSFKFYLKKIEGLCRRLLRNEYFHALRVLENFNMFHKHNFETIKMSPTKLMQIVMGKFAGWTDIICGDGHLMSKTSNSPLTLKMVSHCNTRRQRRTTTPTGLIYKCNAETQ